MGVTVILFDAANVCKSDWKERLRSTSIAQMTPDADDCMVIAVRSAQEHAYAMVVPGVPARSIGDGWVAAIDSAAYLATHVDAGEGLTRLTVAEDTDVARFAIVCEAARQACEVSGAWRMLVRPIGFDLSEARRLQLSQALPEVILLFKRSDDIAMSESERTALEPQTTPAATTENAAPSMISTVTSAETRCTTNNAALASPIVPSPSKPARKAQTVSSSPASMPSIMMSDTAQSTRQSQSIRRKRTVIGIKQPPRSFVPITFAALSLFVLVWALLIRNVPELDIGTWPAFMDLPVKAVQADRVMGAYSLIIVLVSSMVGLPYGMIARTVLVVAADAIYLALCLLPSNQSGGLLAVLMLYDFYGLYVLATSAVCGSADPDVEIPWPDYRFTSTRQVFVRTMLAGVAVCVVVPLPLALTRMGTSSAFRSAGAGTGLSSLVGTRGWWLSYAVVMVFALCAACMLAVHRREGFWGGAVGGVMGMLMAPAVMITLMWLISDKGTGIWDWVSIAILPVAAISAIVKLTIISKDPTARK